MLQANPNLTYRDVQHIIANTARVNDANVIWQVNGAGHDVSHKSAWLSMLVLLSIWQKHGQQSMKKLVLNQAYLISQIQSYRTNHLLAFLDTVITDRFVLNIWGCCRYNHNFRGDLEMV